MIDRKMFLTIYSILGYTLIFFLIIDNLLTFYIKKRYPDLDNPYFNLHKKYGFFKITIAKLLVALFIVDSLLLRPIGGLGTFSAVIFVYVYYVSRLFVDLVKTIIGENRDSAH